MWEAVELREIRVLLAVAEELHFGRAAERLGLTQSRVSQSLRELELKLGSELVHRTSRRVSLTTAGERFLAEIAPVVAELERTLRSAAGEGEIRGALRVGLLNAVPQPQPLIEAITAFEAGHPGCSVEVRELMLSTRYEPLRRGEVDVIAGPPPQGPADLEIGPRLPGEPRVLAVSADHPLAERDAVTTEDIADYEVVDIAGLVPEEWAPDLIPERSASGRPMKRRRLEHHDWSTLQTSIARGRIVHPAFAGQFAHPGICTVPITDLPAWETVLVTLRNRDGPMLQAFLDEVERRVELSAGGGVGTHESSHDA